MKNIDTKYVILAFIAELGVDIILGGILLYLFGQGKFTPDLTAMEYESIARGITQSTEFMMIAVPLGFGTTVLGGYLAARLAKKFPYYQGLGIGIVGVVWIAFHLGNGPIWLNVLGLLATIPLSIFGAHLAKQRMDPKLE